MRIAIAHVDLVLLWHLALLLLACSQRTSDAVVNLNLKSSKLSNLLRSVDPIKEGADDNDNTAAAANGVDESSSERGQKSTLEKPQDIIQLDLSGRINALIAGPVTPRDPNSLESPAQPLVILSEDNPLSFIFSTDYDFSRCWYGARRLVGTLQWAPQSPPASSFWRHFVPSRVDVSREEGLQCDEIGANQAAAHWSREEKLQPTLQVRQTDTGDKSLSVQIRPRQPNNRLTYELNLHSSERLLPVPARSEACYLPDITVNALGHVEARNEVGFPWRNAWWGTRLAVRRRLGWTALGLAADTDPDTWVRLDVSHSTDTYATTAQLGLQLEEWRSTAHFSLRQDVVVPGN